MKEGLLKCSGTGMHGACECLQNSQLKGFGPVGVVGIHPANAVGDDIEAGAGTGTVLGELAGSGGEKESR